MLRHGHRILGDYPARFGHETAGVRTDTGERVLVGDSVACGACGPCRAGRAAICRAPTWVLGGFAERIAAPPGALHAIPDGLDFAGAAMAEPLAACVHAMARGTDAADVAVLGGGTIGLMLARLLVLDGRDVVVCDRHPERRAQAEAMGARSAERAGRARSRLRGGRAPRGVGAGRGRGAPGRHRGARRRLPGGQHGGARDRASALRRGRRARRLSPHARRGRPGAGAAGRGDVDWRALAGPVVGLEQLAGALRAPAAARRASSWWTRSQ